MAFVTPRLSTSLLLDDPLYRVGTQVDVYYNPLDPTESALQVGWRTGILFKGLVVVGLSIVSLLLWVRLA